MRRIILVALIVSLAGPAMAFNNDNRLRVTSDGGTDFTVNYKLGARPTDYWCAAGRYVLRELGQPRKTRVFRLSPPPQRRGEGIRFTLDAARSSGSTGLTIFGGAQDGSISAGIASASNCYNVDIRKSGSDN